MMTSSEGRRRLPCQVLAIVAGRGGWSVSVYAVVSLTLARSVLVAAAFGAGLGRGRWGSLPGSGRAAWPGSSPRFPVAVTAAGQLRRTRPLTAM
jgi:hypothetical protein